MIHVLHLSSRCYSFSSPCSYQSDLSFSVSGRLSPHNFEMYSISSLLFSLLVFQQFRSRFCCKRAPSRSCFPFVHSSPFSLLFRRHCIVALFNPSSCFVRIMFFSWLIHLTGVLCPFFLKFSHFIKSCIPSQPECYPDRFLLFLFLNGVLWTLFSSVVSFLPICSTPQGSWFHSFVKEAT